VQPSSAARMSPSGNPGSNSCIRHSRTQPTATEYAGVSNIVTVARSPGEAVVSAPLPAFALLVSSTTPPVLIIAVLKSNGFPLNETVVVALLSAASAPSTSRSANRIEIRISRFLEGAIFAVTSSSVTFRRKLGEDAAQETMRINDASTLRFHSGTRGRPEPF